ncbi:MAG: T9SS type A sorting domain-containing protein, partial [Vicingaceae bacterium]|nr:T9SS type A sorting domain-containing protein [Vicingaceae bacterium]
SNNTAVDTLTNIFGCDSVVTLDLTINNNTGVDIQNYAACTPVTWNGITYTASNYTALDTMTNVFGCDSVVTLNLTIGNSTGIDTHIVCDSLNWNGITYTSSNSTAVDTLLNSLGCDSVVTLNLTVNNSSTGTDIQTACESFTWNGITYTNSNNTALDTLTNSLGCDSIVTLDLTITSIDTLVSISGDGITLTASNTNAAYQWIDCTNGNSLIIGATNQSYTATANGDYAVMLTENGCIDTSDCITVTSVGIEGLNNSRLIKIFPNPTKENITIVANGKFNYVIRSVVGNEVLHGKGINKENISLNDLSKGTYFISIITKKDPTQIIKIVKE